MNMIIYNILPVDHNYGWGSINVKAKKPALIGKENIV